MSSVIGLTKIGDVHVTLGNVGGTIRRLASLERDQPEMSEKIKVKCHACGTVEFEVHRLAESWCACDACCENWDKEEVMSKIRDYWADFCPELFRETDPKHPQFPVGIWKSLKSSWDAQTSLLLFGPTGSAKTRTAMLLLQLALIKGKTIAACWPEELTEWAKGRDRLSKLHQLGKVDVLLLDDALLTGAADERVGSFLKDLIDYSQRHGNTVLLTTQVGGQGYAEASEKWGNSTRADRERIEALLRRIRQFAKVVPFMEPKPSDQSF
ncbi:MAG: hypothetical protein Unbinned1322contig1001_25 [Prokaryotic dsDNA virus sp.]|nr:MAG: hypothetical protein Unbinned1322contig1001_25 [Prokaryotic dsDNA virus sp.]|tara:strand:+ start:27725 stop:28528 length:804 start_codon:yes stop_codon:yes gene_type:complete